MLNDDFGNYMMLVVKHRRNYERLEGRVMSMNLSLMDKTTNCDVVLWQTPTHITWMCLSYNPETKEPDGGHEGVRRRYLEWVKSHTDGVWKDKEDLDWIHERVRQHSKAILAVKDPEFSFV